MRQTIYHLICINNQIVLIQVRSIQKQAIFFFYSESLRIHLENKHCIYKLHVIKILTFFHNILNYNISYLLSKIRFFQKMDTLY